MVLPVDVRWTDFIRETRVKRFLTVRARKVTKEGREDGLVKVLAEALVKELKKKVCHKKVGYSKGRLWGVQTREG